MIAHWLMLAERWQHSSDWTQNTVTVNHLFFFAGTVAMGAVQHISHETMLCGIPKYDGMQASSAALHVSLL